MSVTCVNLCRKIDFLFVFNRFGSRTALEKGYCLVLLRDLLPKHIIRLKILLDIAPKYNTR